MGSVFSSSSKHLPVYIQQYPMICLMLDGLVYVAFIKHATSMEVLTEHRSLHYSLSASVEDIVFETVEQLSTILGSTTLEISRNFSDEIVEVSSKNIEDAVLSACKRMMRLETVTSDVERIKYPYKDYGLIAAATTRQ